MLPYLNFISVSHKNILGLKCIFLVRKWWGKLLLKVTKLRYTSYCALVTGNLVTVPLLSYVIDLTK